jgi:hypothetical protein
MLYFYAGGVVGRIAEEGGRAVVVTKLNNAGFAGPNPKGAGPTGPPVLVTCKVFRILFISVRKLWFKVPFYSLSKVVFN